MKIVVAIKRVIDFKAAVRLKADGSAVETDNVKMAMNPFDEIAVEEAIRLKEKGVASEVIVVSIGESACQETLRTALAMGADRALWVAATTEVQPLAVAKVLQAIASKEEPQLIILGKQAIDSDDNQVGQMLAGLLGWAQGTFVSKVDMTADKVQVVREIDGGLETLLLTLPAVLTTDLRLNEPRFLSLPNIVKAKKKPLDRIPLESLAVDSQPRVTTLNVAMPQKTRRCVKVATVAELIDRLTNEAQVLS